MTSLSLNFRHDTLPVYQLTLSFSSYSCNIATESWEFLRSMCLALVTMAVRTMISDPHRRVERRALFSCYAIHRPFSLEVCVYTSYMTDQYSSLFRQTTGRLMATI
jgi:hypothetical protein